MISLDQKEISTDSHGKIRDVSSQILLHYKQPDDEFGLAKRRSIDFPSHLVQLYKPMPRLMSRIIKPS